MKLVHLNYVFDAGLGDPDALLDRYATLTSWNTALASLGEHAITVVQRFHRDETIAKNGVTYVFCADGPPGVPAPWLWPRRMHRAVAALSPDIVHVNGLDFPVQTWLLRRVLPRSAAIVVQDHASNPPAVPASRRLSHAIRSTLRRRAMQAADAFFFTATLLAEPWQQGGFIRTAQTIY